MKAKDAAGNASGSSNVLTITTSELIDLQPPSAPTQLVVSTKTDSTVSLSWTASSDDIGVTGYKIYNGQDVAGESVGTSFTVEGLTPYTEYSFTVKALDAVGNLSESSNSITVRTLPQKPTNIVAVASATSITITWDAIAYADGYDVEIDGQSIEQTTAASYIHVNPDPNTSHSYRVRTRVASDFSEWSDIITVGEFIEMPGNVIASALDTCVTITWDPVVDATGYDVEADGVVIDNGTATLYKHIGLIPGSEHTYRVRAKGPMSVSAWTELLTITTKLGTPVSGTINQNTVWDLNGSPYLVQGNLTVASGAILQIMPGVVVKLNPSCFIHVYGKLNAEGTLDDNVVFTIKNDPDYGGTGATIDYWGMLCVWQTGELNIENVIMRFGGNGRLYYGGARTGITCFGNVSIIDSIIQKTYSEAVRVETDGNIIIQNTQIVDCGGTGIYVNKFGTGNLEISENTIARNVGDSIYVRLNDLNSSIFSKINDNIMFRNGKDIIKIDGSIKTDINLTGNNNAYVFGSITVPQGLNLTIDPGVILKCDYWGNGITVQGKITALGLIDKPIVFTSIKDSHYGGSGVVSAPWDYWNGIWISNTGEFIGDYVVVNYAGRASSDRSFDVKGKLVLKNSQVQYGYYHGIYITSDLDVSIENTSIMNVGQMGIYLNSTGPGNVAIKSCLIEKCGSSGVLVNQFGIGSLEISNNNFTNNVGKGFGISLNGLNSSIFSGIVNNSYSGNANNYYDNLVIWGNPKVNLTFASDVYLLDGTMTIPSNVTVSIEPGAKIKAPDSARQINVDGKLIAHGTAELPIIFTTFKDPVSRFGLSGITGGGIRVNPTGEFDADFIKVKFGYVTPGYSNIAVYGKLILTNSEIIEAVGDGIHFETTIQPVLRFNIFKGNGTAANNSYYALSNLKPSEITIDASYNYWSSPYGPGFSQRVTSGVLYTPWLGSEFKQQIHFGQEGAYGPTGNYSKNYTDMSINSPGFEVAINRTYNSKDDRTGGGFGKGWTFGFESTVKDYGNNVPIKVVRLPEGSAQSFMVNSDGTFAANDSRSKLEKLPDGTFVLTSKDQYSYGYNASGYLIWMKDRNGNTITVEVDETGKVFGITDQAQRHIDVAYENGLIKSIRDFNGRQVQYEYENNKLVRAIDPVGNITRYGYDSEGFLNEIRNHESQTIESVVYDHAAGENQHKINQMVDIYGNARTYVYDNINRKTTITDTNGRETVQWYDSFGFVTNNRDPEGRNIIIEYFLDGQGINKYGEEKSATDRNGNKTQYERDGAGNVTKIINPNASYKQQGYDDKNNLISERDEEGKYTFYIYDAQKKNLLKKAQPLNGTDQYTIGCDESKFAITVFEYYSEAEGASLGYRAKGLVKTVTDPEGNITSYTYYADGNVKTIRDPETNEVTTYEYNGIGLKTAQITPKGYRTSFAYDQNGNLEKAVQQGSETTRIVYDSAGRKVKEVTPNLYDPSLDDLANHMYSGDHGTRMQYYFNGEVHFLTDAEGNTTAYTYDMYGNVRTETKPNGAVYRYEYDVMDRLLKTFFKENANGEEFLLEEYTYLILADKNTQRTQIRYLNSSETASTAVKYDYANREYNRLNADGTTIATGYYLNGTLKSVADARGYTTYYRYDGLNRLAEQWTPFEGSGSSTKYTYGKIIYDKAGKQKQNLLGKGLVSLYAVPTTFAVTEYEYYKNGSVKSVIDGEGRKKEYQYDDDGVLSKESVYLDAVSKNTVNYSNNYLGKPDSKKVYIKAGDLYGNSFTNMDDHVLTTTFTYDKNGNLKTATTPDEVTTTYSYDNLNRQTGVSQVGVDEFDAPATINVTTQYNWEGKPLFVIDAANHTTTYSYDSRGFLKSTTDAKQGVAAYYYDRAGRKIAEVSAENYDPSKALAEMSRIEYVYDKMDRVKTISDIYLDPVSSQWVTIVSKAYKYDNNGNVLKELDALGFETGTGATVDDKINSGYGTEFTYNAANKVLTSLDAVSKQRNLTFTSKYSYDALGRKLTETDAKNVVTCYYYDDAANVTKVSVKKTTNDPEQIVKINTYDYAGNLLTQTDGNGNTVTFAYNAWNKIRQTVNPGDTTVPSNTTIYQYDPAGNLKKQQDSFGTTNLYTYDNQGRQLSSKQQKADGSQTITKTTKFDLNGNKRFETDGNGTTKQYTYDELNRLKSTNISVSGVNQTTAYSYDKNGNRLTETDWRNNTITFVYDPLNRLLEKKDAYNKVIEKFEYNHNNAQIESFDALDNLTQYQYDRNNRLVKTIDPENHETSQTYDNVGNVISKIDGNSKTTTYAYDEFKRLTTVTNAKNEATAYTYDLNGNVLTFKDGRNKVVTYEYNALNLMTKCIEQGGRTGTAGNYTYDLSKVESYTYAENGLLLTKIDKKGITTTNTYDSHGRQIEMAVDTTTISYTYDDNGNVLTTTDGTGTTTRTYDELNRAITKDVPNFGLCEYAYDLTQGVPTGCIAETSTDSKGNVVRKVYDRVGRMLEVLADGMTTSYTYYDNGSLQKVEYDNGSSEEYTYTDYNLLSTLINKKADGTMIDSYTYTYDNAHNMLSKVDAKGTTSYTYDALNRLLTVTEPTARLTTYSYDASGNRLTETVVLAANTTITTYTYDDQNRLTNTLAKLNNVNKQGVAYTDDNNGNQLVTTKTDYINGVAQTPVVVATNTYDVLNQLIGTAILGGDTIANTYNGDGLRVEKVVNSETTRYLYEYGKVVLEQDGQNNQTAWNVYGSNLISRKVGTDTLTYMYNGHADVTSLLDTSGNLVATYYYDAFGNILEKTGTADNNILYSGYQYDEETGLYYLNARMYDPITARFLQKDTYRGQYNDPLSLNLYTYCKNEPLKYADPTGHRPVFGDDPLHESDDERIMSSDVMRLDKYKFKTKYGVYWKQYEKDRSKPEIGEILYGVNVENKYNDYCYSNYMINGASWKPMTREQFVNEHGAIWQKDLEKNKVSTDKAIGQLVMGNYYPGDPTSAGVGLQISAGLVGVDAPGDAVNLYYDVTHWEWSWKHVGQTVLDGVGFLPVIGGLKYADEVAALFKNGDGIADAAKHVDEAADGLKGAGKIDIPKLPSNAKVLKDPKAIYNQLEKYHGIDPKLASERLHEIKQAAGRGPADNVVFDMTGNVFDPVSKEWLGSLTQGGGKRIK